MKKLYKIILLCIAVALFISCDEKKAEDDIKKAFTKITDEAADVVDAVDKITPKPKGSGTLTNTKGEEAEGEGVEETEDTPPPALTKPAVSSYRVKVGEVIRFPKEEGHTYRLKQAVNGVSLDVSIEVGQVTATEAASGVVIVATLDDSTVESVPIEFVKIFKPVFNQTTAPWDTSITFQKVLGYTYELKQAVNGVSLDVSDENIGEITATQSAQNVIIIVTHNGLSAESEPIEFTRIPGNTLSFADEDIGVVAPKGAEVYQVATKSGGVAGDERAIVYSIIPIGSGGTIDSASGAVTLDTNAENINAITFTITAELPQTEKYERATATYDLGIRAKK